MLNLGVANVDRSANGVRYTITRDADNGITGYVEVTNGVNNVRNYYDEPVTVGSPKYDNMMNAVRRYQAWAEGIKVAFATAPRALERVE